MTSSRTPDLAGILDDALAYAKDRGYLGYNKHDGLASPLLRALTLGRKWPRILAIQAVMRFPMNIRPLLFVSPVENPKGLALFARSWLHRYRRTGDPDSLQEAVKLLDRLLTTGVSHSGGLGWGYQYPWQDLGFYAPAGFPNRIVTTFVGRALSDGYAVTGEGHFLEGAEAAVRFLLDAPGRLKESEDELCLAYLPDPGTRMIVMDVSILAGALAAIVGKQAGIASYTADARRLVAYVASRQTEEGAWYYTDPPGQGPITHDNYHTGEILDAFLDYQRATGDASFRPVYDQGLAFYRERLFTRDARPKWMHDRTYPHDAHGYSQGIITFTLAGDREFAAAVASAAIDDLYVAKEHRFAWQRRPLLSRRFTLMRWCQAWLCFALAFHLDESPPS